MATPRPCLNCGTLTTTTRCTTCTTPRPPRPHYNRQWATLSQQLRRTWIDTYGWLCPGWQRPPHPATDLTVDHINPRQHNQGLQILCRSCNSTKGTHNQPTTTTPSGGG